MHLYVVMRGSGKLMRRVIEDLEDIYLPYTNEKTGANIGMLQLMPREVKTFEIAFPAPCKKKMKDIVRAVCNKHNIGKNGGVTPHFGPFKKDKYNVEGAEII